MMVTLFHKLMSMLGINSVSRETLLNTPKCMIEDRIETTEWIAGRRRIVVDMQ